MRNIRIGNHSRTPESGDVSVSVTETDSDRERVIDRHIYMERKRQIDRLTERESDK